MGAHPKLGAVKAHLPLLVALSGLPGVGKTTVARELARVLGAVHVRIDTIEQALRQMGREVGIAGYAVAYAIAEDNLRLGQIVVADGVNPVPATRDAWRAVAARAGCDVVEVEIVCSDAEAHRRRVESRVADIPGHPLPTWADVTGHDYQPWPSPRLVVDTAQQSAGAWVESIMAAIRARAVR